MLYMDKETYIETIARKLEDFPEDYLKNLLQKIFDDEKVLLNEIPAGYEQVFPVLSEATEEVLRDYSPDSSFYKDKNFDYFLRSENNEMIKINSVLYDLKQKKKDIDDKNSINLINLAIGEVRHFLRGEYGLNSTKEERLTLQENIYNTIQQRMENSTNKYSSMSFEEIKAEADALSNRPEIKEDETQIETKEPVEIENEEEEYEV